MNAQTKLLTVLTIAAIVVIGAYAWRVLPAYFQKPLVADNTTPYTLRVLPIDQVRGRVGASKTVIEFGDIECPYCGAIEPQIISLIGERPDVRLVWKDCPLPSHPNAQKAAEAALCAGDQGKYWEYHDLLIASNDQLGPELYASTAGSLKLDTDRFIACLDGNTKRGQVLNSLSECAVAGVEELPWLSVNGKTFSGSGIISNLINELNK